MVALAWVLGVGLDISGTLLGVPLGPFGGVVTHVANFEASTEGGLVGAGCPLDSVRTLVYPFLGDLTGMFENQILGAGREDDPPGCVGLVRQGFGRNPAPALGGGGEACSQVDSGFGWRWSEILDQVDAGGEAPDDEATPDSDNYVENLLQDWHSEMG